MKVWLAGVLMVSFFAATAEGAEMGLASWYSRTDSGIRQKTASGEVFNDAYATCASWHYPIGTWLKITNVRNGKSVTVRVNDRGPKRSLKRVVDLTKGSFRLIANPKHGLAKVTVAKSTKPKLKKRPAAQTK